MASIEQVNRYFAASDMENQIKMLSSGVFDQIAMAHLEKGDVEESVFATIMAEAQRRVHAPLMENARRLYTEHFTDAEIDQLIEMVTSPIAQKMRGFGHIAQKSSLDMFMSGKINVPKIFDDIMSEMDADETADETKEN